MLNFRVVSAPRAGSFVFSPSVRLTKVEIETMSNQSIRRYDILKIPTSPNLEDPNISESIGWTDFKSRPNPRRPRGGVRRQAATRCKCGLQLISCNLRRAEEAELRSPPEASRAQLGAQPVGWLPMAGSFLPPGPLEEELVVWSGAWYARWQPCGGCVLFVIFINRASTRRQTSKRGRDEWRGAWRDQLAVAYLGGGGGSSMRGMLGRGDD